jgi:cellulose synthase/poly-beta-1,6-N-acetylglucosamine synthase-like glycosyltransferase/peptidoglycan/xylan/chitin deacetylase (PgdA/CDA1 family)
MSAPLGDRPELARRLRVRLWSPPGHWALVAVCLLAAVSIIMFEGITAHQIGVSAEPPPATHQRAPLAGSDAILVASSDTLTAREPPPGNRIALTFDDGPDPAYTPQITELLAANHISATFFVIGSEAARNPGLIKAEVAGGDELGNHTFTHEALTVGPMWRARAQIELTEATLVGITGHYTRFVRPPYSATPGTVTAAAEKRLAQLAGQRYTVVLADYDSNDWRRPGVNKIVANATPHGRTGGVIMFHDGGGDRSQTVAALRLLIPRLKQRGFRFVPLSALAGISPAVAEPAASGYERLRGEAFDASVRVAYAGTQVLAFAVAAVGVLVTLRILAIFSLAWWMRRRERRRVDPEFTPPVAVIVPAYNEAVGIERAIRSLAASDYPDFEIVVVDDGSKDATAAIVLTLDLDRVHLVRQDNGGKAAALNTGIRLTRAPVVVMVDGDTVFERDTIRRLVAPMADPNVAAVSGNTKVGNRSGLLGRWQHIEYVTGFNLDRRLYEALQCTPTVPGAIGAFRRDVLLEVGGVPGDTLAEDTDLTLAIGRTGHKVLYAPDARAWTEAPSTFGGLWRQRYRWSYGTMQAVWKHRGALFTTDRRQRRIGRLALPYIFFFQILLPVAAPLIDLFTIYGAIFTNPGPVLAFWCGFNLLQLLLAVYAFKLDGESTAPLWSLPLQQFVYRQLMYVVVIESTLSALVGVRAAWRHIPRTGDVTVPAASGRL